MTEISKVDEEGEKSIEKRKEKRHTSSQASIFLCEVSRKSLLLQLQKDTRNQFHNIVVMLPCTHQTVVPVALEAYTSSKQDVYIDFLLNVKDKFFWKI